MTLGSRKTHGGRSPSQILPRLQKAVPSMMISLSEELVLATMERMKAGTTPGAARLPVEVFMALLEGCVRPVWAVQHCLQQVAYPLERVISLQRNILETPMAGMLADPRPIAL